MSELKHQLMMNKEHSLVPAYIKAEVDKVIEELKEKHKTEVKELLCLIRDKDNNFNRSFDSVEKEIRHNKYKRCLAMAKLCAWEQRFWGDGVPAYERQFQWENRASKWKKRWLKIAEKFKETK